MTKSLRYLSYGTFRKSGLAPVYAKTATVGKKETPIMIATLLAALPILLILVLMLGFRWNSARAGSPVGRWVC
jgi:hypothetical protein